ncbi:Pao retrotransposon peptidase family protein [Aphelenchoides avenae]|nr:Pao retrotransposon peptidase family protein [Aphelenchus avenae]
MKMNIREFISNCPQFNAAIPEEDRAKQTKESTLGHEWDSQLDAWRFRLPEPNPFKRANEESAQVSYVHRNNAPLSNDPQDEEPQTNENLVMVSRKVKSAKYLTKRVMLSILHGLWDPLGIFAPLTLQARLVHQDSWVLDLKWDDPVPETVVKAWEEATASWSGSAFEVPRHLFSYGRPAKAQLHVFVDASGDGYGAVAYLRITSREGKTYSQMLFAKNRVKTRKPVLTIPRKELMAALIGCRVINFLRKELLPELNRMHTLSDIPTYLWGDNQGVLYWIKDSAHVYGKFVQNRLSEIRSTENVTFRYVPTKDNPADVLSRGATTYELKSHTLWWHGPSWLTESESLWPAQISDFQPFAKELLGIDGKKKEEVVFPVQVREAQPQTLFDYLRLKLNKQDRYYRFMRGVLRRMLSMVGIALDAKKREPKLPFLKWFLPSHNVGKDARLVDLMQYQATEFALVWNSQRTHPPTQAQVAQFNVETFPDGLLRCRGRLGKGPVSYDTANPIWLPEKTGVAKHIILSAHVLNAHAPVETTLALIRRRFWLVKARRNIRQTIKNCCSACRLVRGPAFRIPDYAQLPRERLTQSRPFAHIGLDLFGPFQVRMGITPAVENSDDATPRRGRKATKRNSNGQPSDLKKVWGVIFTCMATRAVHLEVTHSQSAEHLLHAMSKFMARRGHPNSVTSDNAPSIILVNRALAEMWKGVMDDPSMQGFARQHAIEWHFITPESPWQGGFYERLIRSVKHCLSATIGRRRLEYSNFEQLLVRVEHTVNCRPLTYQTEGDVNAVALRPIDFLQPLAEVTTNMGPVPEDKSDPEYTHKLSSEQRLVKLYAQQNALLEAFWERWSGEYLLSLREKQQRLNNAGRLDRLPQVGEYVMVDDEELMPRAFWKVARIEELLPSRDGLIRNVKVRFPGGYESTRTVQQLHPLELWPGAQNPQESA